MPVQRITQQMQSLIGRYESERDNLIANVVRRHVGGVMNFAPLHSMHDRYMRSAVDLTIAAWGPVIDINGTRTLGDGEAWRDIASAQSRYQSAVNSGNQVSISDVAYMRAKDRAKSLLAMNGTPLDFRNAYSAADDNVRMVLQEAHGELITSRDVEWNHIRNLLESDRRKRTHTRQQDIALNNRVTASQQVYTCYQFTQQLFDLFGRGNSQPSVSVGRALQRQGLNAQSFQNLQPSDNMQVFGASDYLASAQSLIYVEQGLVEVDNTIRPEYRFIKQSTSFGGSSVYISG